MSIEEAREAVVGVYELEGWDSSPVDRLITEVKASMPCYSRLNGRPAPNCFMFDDGVHKVLCPSCEARQH